MKRMDILSLLVHFRILLIKLPINCSHFIYNEAVTISFDNTRNCTKRSIVL